MKVRTREGSASPRIACLGGQNQNRAICLTPFRFQSTSDCDATRLCVGLTGDAFFPGFFVTPSLWISIP